MQSMDLTVGCLGEKYPRLLERVFLEGDEVRPRGELVKEVSPLDLTLTSPRHCIVARPGMNRALVDAERLLIVAGSYDESLYEALSPGVTRLLTGHGAYGPRVAGQLLVVDNELRTDPDSRRAIVYIGRSGDLEETRKGWAPQDVPCTTTWQFLVRDRMLHMFVNMRSWDLVWGLAGDVPVFVTIQLALASSLGLSVGTYNHRAVSGHIYERHFGVRGLEPKNCRLDWVPSGGLLFAQQTVARSVASQLGMIVQSMKSAGSIKPLVDDIASLRDRYPNWEAEITSITERADDVLQKARDS